ncbi:PTS cellobiose transporter subunit IIA [Sediminibacillus dalangtanensis]|uniref:PTS cellobiose transporter subunit IIA n=1 Tax=Sediminibacillus dalangtanensis TaxID=2729421 RepID=A0ABX7VY49_9BACI|nr:PTS lactose/cellobiose transporter subunit IIA [Sediminibacillus dalangtanensis]QTN00706.1 PTS cellobiose transporter subunit IIA [Sediminibacillus dalangtanensis]
MKIEDLSMQIILYAGNAKAFLHEALHAAKHGQFDEIESKRKQAADELLKAHKIQTSFLQEDAVEQLDVLPVLLVHAQDHLMTVMSEKDLIEELILLHQQQHETNRKLDRLLEIVKMQEQN